MMFLDWQFTAQDEYLDQCYQYREAFVLVDAMYRDVPVMVSIHLRAVMTPALSCGWTRGFQRDGSIFQTPAPLRSQARLRRCCVWQPIC
jgi:acetoacetate decarboxylase